MLNKLAVTMMLAGCLSAPAFADQAHFNRPLQLELKQPPAAQGYSDLTVSTRRSAMGVIATDALYGGLAGLAVGAGVALIQNDGNWGRDLALGAGIGLLAGGIFGAVDVLSSGYSNKAYADERTEGSRPLQGPKIDLAHRF